MTAGRRYATFVAAAVTGVQGIVTLVIAKSALGDQFAPLAQLWAMWAVSAAALTYGTQQWGAVRPAGSRLLLAPQGRALATLLGTLSVAVFVATYLLRTRLFSTDDVWWPALAGLLPLGSSLIGLTRGETARTGKTYWLAAVIVGENTIRLAATLVLVWLGASAEWYGLALVAGFAMALAPPLERSDDEALDLVPLATAVGVGLASHALLFGAPLILALSGGSNEDAVLLFLVLSAVRAPFVLLQALIPQVAVRFGADPGRLQTTVRLLTLVGSVGAVVAFIGGITLGDAIVGPVFSIRGEVDGLLYGLIGGAALISIALSLLTVRFVAGGLIRPLVLAWILPVVATLAATISGILDDLVTVAAWTLGIHALVLCALALLARHGVRASESATTPVGSLRTPSHQPLTTPDDPHAP